MLSKVNKYLFIIMAVLFAVTYFTRDNYRAVDEISLEVLNAPVQVELYECSMVYCRP